MSLKRLLSLAALLLPLAPAEGFASAANPVSVGASAWVFLGYGPMEVTAPSVAAGTAEYFAGAVAPASVAVQGRPIPPDHSVYVNSTQGVWALAPGASSPVTVMTGPLALATAASDDATVASDGGKLVHVISDPTAPVAPGQHGIGANPAVSLTAPPSATYAVVCVIGAAATVTYDGSTPTASIGSPGTCWAATTPRASCSPTRACATPA